jgi:hypothetical protein
MEAKPANELEGLIRDRLPDPVRRHLVDVIIDRTDVDGLGPNWTAQPVWNHDVSNNDKREFTSALFAVLRDYELLTCGVERDQRRMASKLLLDKLGYTSRRNHMATLLDQRGIMLSPEVVRRHPVCDRPPLLSLLRGELLRRLNPRNGHNLGFTLFSRKVHFEDLILLSLKGRRRLKGCRHLAEYAWCGGEIKSGGCGNDSPS